MESVVPAVGRSLDEAPPATFAEKNNGHQKGHNRDRGRIQPPSGEPLPVALVKKLVKARMVENEKKPKK